MLPKIDPKKETEKIEQFLQELLSKTEYTKLVIACSGGIDSSTSLALAARALGAENIHVLYLPYRDLHSQGLQYAKDVADFLQIPHTNQEVIDISPMVNAITSVLGVDGKMGEKNGERIRMGNIMARVRMITLFDRAKKLNALVLGTENKSEYHLSYFTRFGDEASDIEPIQHLYKTQVYQVASYLGLPKHVLSQAPTAGLWDGQTDEGEFGFSYKEADPVLYLFYDKKMTVEEIVEQGHANAEKIVEWAEKNRFKHEVPYSLDEMDELW